MLYLSAALDDRRCPCRVPSGVTGRQVRLQGYAPEPDLFAVPHGSVGREGLPQLTAIAAEVAAAAVGDDRLVRFGRQNSCAGPFLQLRVPANVIGVSVRVQNDLDVGQPESELLNAVAHPRLGLGVSGVDEDVSLRRRDQKRPGVRGTDVVNVSDDAERRERFTRRAAGAFLCCRGRGRDTANRQDHKDSDPNGLGQDHEIADRTPNHSAPARCHSGSDLFLHE